jgi:hypothetical protein
VLDIADDGRLQVTAGLALLETSELVTWHCDAERFESVTFNEFECALKHFHRVFGRVICWIIFSAGAEFLAKGVCLLHGIDVRTQDCVPAYPNPDDGMAKWLGKKRVNLTSKRLQNLTADDLDRVMSFLDQLEASDIASRRSPELSRSTF